MSVEQSPAPQVTYPPHHRQDLFPTQDTGGMAHKELEEGKLDGSERERRAPLGDLVGKGIQLQSAEGENLSVLIGRRAHFTSAE